MVATNGSRRFAISGALILVGGLLSSLSIAQTGDVPGVVAGRGESAAVAAKVARTKPFTSTEVAEMGRRIALSREIISSISAEASSRGLADTWRTTTMNMLLGMDSVALTKLRDAGTYDSIVAGAAQAARKGYVSTKVLGDIANDLTYVSVTPCRLIDTRNVSGKINGTRGYDLDVVGNPYGGPAACNIETMLGVDEDTIGAFLFNVTIIDPAAAPGFVAVRPTGTTAVTSLVNWYEAGPSVQAANAAILPGANTGNGLGGNVNAFDIVTSTSVHVIVDFFGAFVRPQATPLQCTFGTKSSSSVGANANASVFAAACPTGYTAVSISCDSQAFNVDIVSFDLDNAGAPYCAYQNNNASAISAAAQLRCCRTPGR